MDSLLPLGTIIKVNNDKKYYVVVGKNINKDNKKYDYMCYEYPYGYNELKEAKFFVEKNVMSVCFMGNVNNK